MEAVDYELEDFTVMDQILAPTKFNRNQLELLSNGLKSSREVLDLCTGFGNLAKLLVEQGKIVHGYDINPNSLDYTRNKLGNNASNFYPIIGDLNSINIDSRFDYVSCASTLGSIDDLDPITVQIHKTLNPHGNFVLTGIEKSQFDNYKKIMEKDIVELCESGEIKFSKEESDRFLAIVESSNHSDLKDSSQRVSDSLSRNGFKITDKKPFLNGTCYYMVAQKI